MATPCLLGEAWAELSPARADAATMYFSQGCSMGWHPQIIHILLFHTHICLRKDKPSLCSAHVAPSLPHFCFWTDPPCPRTMFWPIPCRPPLKTNPPSDLLLTELCLFLLAAEAGPIPEAAHIICTLDLSNISLITTPGPSALSQCTLGTWEGRDGLVLGCWAELGQWELPTNHVILGKHFIPCFLICSRAAK